MLPVLLVLALTPPITPVVTASPGPTLPMVKGLAKPMALGSNVSEYVRWSLQEMGQAVVVVEGEYGAALPKASTGINIKVFDSKLRLFTPRLPMTWDIPVAPWMDTNTVRSGGNVAGKTYALGWGY